jgi:hypothetical protein
MMKARLQEIWKRIATPPPESISEAASLWGAGMVVDAQSFSNQLSRLQHSLATQGVSRQGLTREAIPENKPAESLAIKRSPGSVA